MGRTGEVCGGPDDNGDYLISFCKNGSETVLCPSESFALTDRELETLRKGEFSKKIFAILAAFPEAVEVQDKNNMLPLHCAVMKQAPFDVVSALLERNQEGSRKKSKDENLPLHLALKGHAKIEVISAGKN